ncbi:hypothetical protein [Streptomyces tailanensis]|uniref:hypothetical protein n=1 Tax=Streptomyces tailanensis TaxID=2569858 RepID=UPI00122E7F55|nr:hypothetical protein [Streptomyces tailanensis]
MHPPLKFDERQADRHLSAADDLLAEELGDDVPEWVSYFGAAAGRGISHQPVDEEARPLSRPQVNRTSNTLLLTRESS